MPFYIRTILSEKSLNVVAIYWLTAIKSPVATDWFQTAQVAPVNSIYRGSSRVSNQSSPDWANNSPKLLFNIFSGNCHFD
jgi:hypothetical protein